MSCYCPSCSNPCSQCCCTTVVGGCPIQLDFSCVLYHKDNNEVTELDGLSLTNGATLELVIEEIDEQVKQLKVSTFSLPCLRVDYVVNTLQQFCEAVDTKLCLVSDDVEDALAASQVELTANDSTTIDFTTSGDLNHTVTASVILSEATGQLITEEADGLHVAPQTLSVDYVEKTISISDGNTINIASLLTSPSGFLGNLSSDPTADDGDYWYNTSSNTLKIKVNGTVKTITTS